jgi:hypothetical protein
MFSRSATGFIAGSAARVGTSGFAAAMALGIEGFVVEPAATLGGSLRAEAVVGLAILGVPIVAFEPDAAPETGFAVAFVTGLAVAFDGAAAADELDAEPDADAAGLAPELVGGTGLGA